MGVTGAGLSLFVLAHMLGNMLLFVSPEAYNLYGHTLIHSKFIYFFEAGLIVLFLLHIIYGVTLTLQNRAARGYRTYLTTSGDKAVTFSSKTMIWTGTIVGVFTIIHLLNFKFGAYYEIVYDGVTVRDLQRLMLELFMSPWYVAWYVFAMLTMLFHLWHGVQSAFQSLGFRHPRYTPGIIKFGAVFAWIVGLGFMSQPLYVYFFLN
ncbi:MAG: hypothetical protein A2X94_05950 [Bdellovibrionales bacterium GWB1_55_8]|nr:MAG: hypothetical protein A2X94_05950 [Bdellovibrionales bacterium GWB1_55_8]